LRLPGICSGDQPKVIDGFSDIMVAVFGDKIGKHARTTVGVAGIPSNNPVIIEMVMDVDSNSKCNFP
jgi:enamine deaminase RidA (YjgF/YER057c/UK114 family)